MQGYFAKLRIPACVVIFLVASGSLLADANSPDVNAPKPAQTNAAGPNAPTWDKVGVAATVNGVDITQDEVNATANPELQRLNTRTGNMPAAIVESLKKQVIERTLERLIIQQLLDGQVEKENIEVTDADVIANLRETGAQQNPPLSLQDIKALIEARGQDFEQLKQQIKTSRQMKYQKLMDAEFAGKLNFTEQDAQNYYSQNRQRFQKPELVKASHILIAPAPSDPNIDPNTDPNQAKAQAREKAEKLLKQIKSGTGDFAALAKEHSACSSAKKGGDLGFFPRGEMVPAFDKAAFSLKPGQVSDVVETRFGYHIIKVTDHQDATEMTFEQVKNDIIRQLKQDKKREIADQYVDSLKSKADIVYPPGKEPIPAAMPPLVRPRPRPK